MVECINLMNLIFGELAELADCTGLKLNSSAMAGNPIVESPKFGGNPLRLL